MVRLGYRLINWLRSTTEVWIANSSSSPQNQRTDFLRLSSSELTTRPTRVNLNQIATCRVRTQPVCPPQPFPSLKISHHADLQNGSLQTIQLPILIRSSEKKSKYIDPPKEPQPTTPPHTHSQSPTQCSHTASCPSKSNSRRSTISSTSTPTATSTWSKG